MESRLKALRRAKGITQTELANRLGVKQNTIACYETGVREPTNAIILSICREFDVNERWLRTGEGEMFLAKPREQELADFFSSVLSVDPPDTRACLIHALSKLSVPQWQALTDVINTMVADWEAQKNRPHE